MLAYGKNIPRNNQFSGDFFAQKNKILPKIKICPISLEMYPKTQNLPSHRVPNRLLFQVLQCNEKKVALLSGYDDSLFHRFMID